MDRFIPFTFFFEKMHFNQLAPIYKVQMSIRIYLDILIDVCIVRSNEVSEMSDGYLENKLLE